MKSVVREEISSTNFVALIADKITMVDNGSLINIYAFIVKN